MCGISGKFSRRGFANTDFLNAANSVMHHRGPDEGAIWTSRDMRVGLAHRRLSIIDLVGGRQPMVEQTSGLVLVFNGEIYNYTSLQSDLKKKGHTFLTNSDTEVILKAYMEWGDRFLEKLTGMFAFCIYDKKRNLLFLARDRVGEKPIYFYEDDNNFIFASELKALLQDKAISRKFNLPMLEYYLTYGAVRGPECLISGVKKILPGHALIYDIEKNQVRLFKYWDLPNQQNSKGDFDTDLVNELENLLEASVSGQLLSDVPVGILLSGGLDSSLITAMATRVSDQPINTFTVSFPGAEGFDESHFAQQISSYFGTRHQVLEVEQFTMPQLEILAEQFDEPIGDQAIIPTYLISKVIGEQAKVALSGDGGDELFAGYSHYSWIKKQALLRQRTPPIFRKILADISRKYLPVGFRGRNHLVGVDGEIGNSISAVNMFFDKNIRKNLLSPLEGKFECTDEPEIFKKSTYQDQNSSLRNAMVSDFKSTLVDTYLVKVDRSSMLASLEVRCPWLDHKIIEFAFSKVPDSMRLSGNKKKILPKLLAQKLLPPGFDISRKQGFNMPMQEWFKSGLKTEMEKTLMDLDDTIFCKSTIREVVSSQEKGNNNMQRIFSLIMLSLWSRHYNVTL